MYALLSRIATLSTTPTVTTGDTGDIGTGDGHGTVLGIMAITGDHGTDGDTGRIAMLTIIGVEYVTTPTD